MTETWATDDRGEELISDLFGGDAAPARATPEPVEKLEPVHVHPKQREFPLGDTLGFGTK